MDKYLENIKANLNTSSENVVVMGNESCDMDSAISSLVYAYFLHWMNQNELPISSSTTKPNSKAFIPIINVKRNDLPIKTEVVYFLKENSIFLENLICRDEVDIESLLSNDGSKLILVDHHILGDADTNLFKYVKSIFDHRPKDVAAWRYDEKVNSKIIEVGSCATLICSEIQNTPENYGFLSKNKDPAYLLYGTIILDTVNLSSSADKARPLDFEMINILEMILNISSPEEYRNKLFEELLKARTDYSKLSVNHLLKRDQKTIRNVPISGFPMLVKEYLDMDGCYDAIESFLAENNYTTLLLMGLKMENGIIHRDMAIYSKNETREVIVESLIESSNPNLGLIEKNCQHENCRYFCQSNVKASRKQIIPILKTIVNL